LKRHAEALSDWERAIELDDGSLRRELRLMRTTTLSRLDDHARTAEAADELAKDPSLDSGRVRLLASVYALSARTAGPSDAADKYAGRTVELLRRAQAAGHFRDPDEVRHLEKSADFDALRGREDFQELLKELKAKPMK
jgi:hypothetical protein